MSEKLKPQHLARKAVLYVRQSSALQVTYNVKSRAAERAVGNNAIVTEFDLFGCSVRRVGLKT